MDPLQQTHEAARHIERDQDHDEAEDNSINLGRYVYTQQFCHYQDQRRSNQRALPSSSATDHRVPSENHIRA